MHDHDPDAPTPTNGQAPEHSGSFATFLANEAARRRAEEGRRPADLSGYVQTVGPVPPSPFESNAVEQANEAAWLFRVGEAARTRAHTTGLAVPMMTNVVAHSMPEVPRSGLRPPPAPADERSRVLLYALRGAADLPRAIRLIREAGAAGTPLPDGLLDRCDRAERAYLVHYQDRLAALTAIARDATRDVLDARGLGEFAAALGTNEFGKLLEGPR